MLELIKLGESKKLDFPAIDANPLSQMFKAKILSLYFPDKFLNVCSRDHLETLGAMLGYADHLPASEYQHLLLDAKRSNPITKELSNPKFMVFLYDVYVREVTTPEVEVIQKPLKKTPKKVNFEDIDKNKKLIGEIAEKYALNWERQRLLGANLEHLIDKIDDRRDRPGYDMIFCLIRRK